MNDVLKKLMACVSKASLTALCWFGLVALVMTFFQMRFAIANRRSLWLCLGGFVAGCALFSFVQMTPLYVAGHELTHWGVAKLFFRKTSKIRLRWNSGSVNVERPNVWITLAPYFVPFYLLLLLAAAGIVSLFWKCPPPWSRQAMAAGIGVTYAYHLVMTVLSIHCGQSDLQADGVCFSVSLILLCNALFLFLAFLLVTHQWKDGVVMLWHQLYIQAMAVAKASMWCIKRVLSWSSR